MKSEMEKSGSFASEKLRFSKRSPFALQKESFYSPKGVLLLSKRSPFTHQKESFYSSKGVLLFGSSDLWSDTIVWVSANCRRL